MYFIRKRQAQVENVRNGHLYFRQVAGREELLVPTCFVKGKKVFGRSFSSVTLIAADYLPTLVLLFIARFHTMNYLMSYGL